MYELSETFFFFFFFNAKSSTWTFSHVLSCTQLKLTFQRTPVMLAECIFYFCGFECFAYNPDKIFSDAQPIVWHQEAQLVDAYLFLLHNLLISGKRGRKKIITQPRVRPQIVSLWRLMRGGLKRLG